MDRRNHRIFPEKISGNPVKRIGYALFSGLIQGVAIVLLTGAPVLPVSAAPGTYVESGMDNGLRHVRADGNVERVWNRLLWTLKAMKAPVFSTIDHKGNAVSAGLDMKEARVVSFGNPAVGTLLMQEKPETALDLPLKILVWESPEGSTMLSWNDPAWIAKRYGADPDSETVRKMQRMIEKILEKIPVQP